MFSLHHVGIEKMIPTVRTGTSAQGYLEADQLHLKVFWMFAAGRLDGLGVDAGWLLYLHTYTWPR